MLNVNANLLVHAPSGDIGKFVTKAASYAVRSLVESDAGRHNLQLTVVAIGCDNPAFDDWQRRMEQSKLATFVPVDSASYTHGRNIGYEDADYLDPVWDVFIEFDTDNVFPYQWFEPMMDAMDAFPEAAILSPGTIRAQHWNAAREPSVDIQYETQTYDYIHIMVDEEARRCVKRYGGRVGEVRDPPVIRRSASFRKMGLYDESFNGSLWNDWDEIMRVRQAGWEVKTILNSFVFHWTAWEKTLLHGWHGQDPLSDDETNRTRFFEKWPDASSYYQEYLAARDRLYYLEDERCQRLV